MTEHELTPDAAALPPYSGLASTCPHCRYRGHLAVVPCHRDKQPAPPEVPATVQEWMRRQCPACRSHWCEAVPAPDQPTASTGTWPPDLETKGQPR